MTCSIMKKQWFQLCCPVLSPLPPVRQPMSPLFPSNPVKHLSICSIKKSEKDKRRNTILREKSRGLNLLLVFSLEMRIVWFQFNSRFVVSSPKMFEQNYMGGDLSFVDIVSDACSCNLAICEIVDCIHVCRNTWNYLKFKSMEVFF